MVSQCFGGLFVFCVCMCLHHVFDRGFYIDLEMGFDLIVHVLVVKCLFAHSECKIMSLMTLPTSLFDFTIPKTCIVHVFVLFDIMFGIDLG